MIACRHARTVQPYLDGDLSPADEERFLAHLSGCVACAAEVGAYEALFVRLGADRIPDPGPALTERILDRVLPSRLRRRLVTAVGWCYTAVSAVSTYVIVSWIARPESHVWLAGRLAEGYLSLLQAGVFVVHALLFSWFRLLDGWGVVGAIAERLAPIVRALALPLSQPMLVALVWTAFLASAAVFWWMRPRRGRKTKKEVRHVVLLGF